MYLRVCAEEKVAGIEISGTPLDKACGKEYIDMLKKAGVKLFHKVGLGAPRRARREDRLRRHLRRRHRGGRPSPQRRRDHHGAHPPHRRVA